MKRVLGSPSAFLPPGVLACHYILIAPEERYLLGRFGDQYGEYAKTHHRWLGRKANTPGRRTPSQEVHDARAIRGIAAGQRHLSPEGAGSCSWHQGAL